MFTQWHRQQKHLRKKVILQLLLQWVAIGFGVNGYPQESRQQQQVLVESDNGTNLRNSDYEYRYAQDWPMTNRTLGSVTAVAFDSRLNVVIFHRGSHVWNALSFDQQNRYNLVNEGPIMANTLLTFDHESGQLVDEWGANFFYMPHGLTIDKNNNFWLTDVAMHQVFKFDPSVSRSKPVLTLGHQFLPGSDLSSFCKPTSVAVLDNGDFFVADGYCNGRVMKFSSEGELLLSWGKNSFFLTRTFTLPDGPVPPNFFAIPHALTYAEDKDLLCVADREQGRIQCFHAQNATFHSMYSNPQIGSRLFSVKYLPQDGGLFFIVNGPQFHPTSDPVSGFILSMESKQIVGRFYPDTFQHAFSNPHELAVHPEGSEIYVAELNPTKVHKFKRKAEPRRPRPTERSSRPPLPDEPAAVMADTLYASGLTIVSIVVSLVGVSCLVMCVFRNMCLKPVGGGGGGSRSQRFSTASENIALRSMSHQDEQQGV